MRSLCRRIPSLASALKLHVVSLAAAASTIGAVWAAPPWAPSAGDPFVFPGIAAATCAAPARDYPSYGPLAETDSFAFGLFDLRTPPPGTYSPNVTSGTLWPETPYHHPDWNVKNIGQVYGITLKPDGEIYLAAHGVYGAAALQLHQRYGDLGGGATDLGAAGTIYRIDNTTGAPSVFAVIPGQQVMVASGFPAIGPGLGNLAYDANHAGGQFFVTSLEDGKIYRVDSSGAVLSPAHDPLSPDSGAAGMPPSGDRIWGVEVLGDSVYYGTWNGSTTVNEVRKVDLTPTGDFIPSSDASVVTLPASTSAWGSVAISDIAFSSDGSEMLVGERTMSQPHRSYNHNSRVHRVDTSSWTVTHSLKTGNNTVVGGGGEAYGGVAYGQEGGVDEQIIWMASADMAANSSGNSPGPHGLFGVRPTDFPVTPAFTPDAFKVPYDPAFSSTGPDNKGSGGDVEILRGGDDCRVDVLAIHCPEERERPYTLDLEVSNYSDNVAQFVLLNPCPDADLPPGAITTSPTPAMTTLATPLSSGDSATLSGVQLPGVPLSGETVCFLVTLLDESGNACCTRKICVDLPRCDCARVLDQEIACELQADGTIKYTVSLTIQNQTHLSANPNDLFNATLIPSPTLLPGLDPSAVSDVTLTPDPITPGSTGVLKFCYVGSPGPIYANIAFHDENFIECCAIEDVCLELPDCGVSSEDECEIARRTPCDPETGLAAVPFTICNNGSTPKTYALGAISTPTDDCPIPLTPGHFTFPATVGPVAPGDCVTVTVLVDCKEFKEGECAQFEICARAVNPGPGERICCPALVYRPHAGAGLITLAGEADSTPTVRPNRETPLRIRVTNPTDEALEVNANITTDESLFNFSIERETSEFFLNTTVSVAPQSSETLTVNVRLREEHAEVPSSFFDLFLEAISPNGEIATTVTPIRLQNTTDATTGRVRVDSIAIDAASSEIILVIDTDLGRRYVVQQAEAITISQWDVVDCEVAGEGATVNGVFEGTGEKMTCRIPCDLSEDHAFYRVQQLQ